MCHIYISHMSCISCITCYVSHVSHVILTSHLTCQSRHISTSLICNVTMSLNVKSCLTYYIMSCLTCLSCPVLPCLMSCLTCLSCPVLPCLMSCLTCYVSPCLVSYLNDRYMLTELTGSKEYWIADFLSCIWG